MKSNTLAILLSILGMLCFFGSMVGLAKCRHELYQETRLQREKEGNECLAAGKQYVCSADAGCICIGSKK